MSEYKRLTKRREDGKAMYACSFRWEAEDEQTILDRLADLEDKIENGTLVELPCKVGDTVYLIYSSEQRNPIPFVVDFIITHKMREEERLFVYDSDGHGGRLGDCCKGNYVWYIGTNKAQAETRLKELKGENA